MKYTNINTFSYMKDQFASYFEKPEFKQFLANYEEMLLSGNTRHRSHRHR